MARICRTCLDRSFHTVSIYEAYEYKELQETQSQIIIDILHSFLSLKFDPSDGLPSDICISCAEETIKMNVFKKKCEKSDEMLRSQYNFVNCMKNDGLDEFMSENDSVNDLSDNSCSKQIKNEYTKRSSKKKASKLNGESKKIYKCKYCEFTSILKIEYVKHRKSMHKRERNRMKLNKSIKSKSESFTEDTEDGTKLFRCNNCNYKTPTKSNMALHLRNHFGDKPFHCDHCDFKTNFRAALQTHLRIHTGEKPFLCDKCECRFKQLAHLKQHKMAHSHERPWPCHLCDYSAKAKRHLDNHLRTHTGEKPFMCDMCSFTCANRVNLQSHKRSHSDTKTFKCDLCNYRSNFKKNLLMHAVKHTGVKAFLCHMCEYKGTCAQHLKAHMISHSQERPFACNVCSYRTKTNSMLNKHLKTHSK